MTKTLTAQEKNERFEAMTASEKRVQLAKDVIAQLDLSEEQRIFKVHPRVYLKIVSCAWGDVLDQIELQKVLCHPSTECEACALGALVAVKAYHYDNCIVKIDKDYSRKSFYQLSILSILKDIFEIEQAHLIENAFEAAIVNKGEEGENIENLQNACVMYFHVHSAVDRLRLVMENVVRNDGDFVASSFEQLTTKQQAIFEQYFP